MDWMNKRVVLDTMLACGRCNACRRGQTELCANSREIGFSSDGNWSDWAALPVANLYSLPDGVDGPQATMIEALTCQMGAVQALGIGYGDTVAIVGSGLAALLFLQLARLRGASFSALIMRPYVERRAMARELGADWVADDATPAAELRAHESVRPDDGFDIAIDAVGTSEAARLTLALPRRGGRALLYGLRSPAVDAFPLADVIFRNLTLYGRTSAPRLWRPAIDLLARGALRLAGMVEIVAMEDLPGLLTGERRGGGRAGPLKRVVGIGGE
jgi:L-iditol 2-dehydrogenase